MIRFATIGTSAIVDRFLEAAALCEGLVHTAVFSRKKETAKAFAKKARSRVYLYRSKGSWQNPRT